ncbi:serine/threonine-protein kinase [Mycoplasmopsis columbinasalis]|uniref:Serine/threonine protein kinase n=1 Tax=Mycoplasmopsis columbinasalis TaxID=114880 RepID=A0A449B9Z8_9BACT|nr:serine/threonine-protein kinase [Mycoplasmopsis columbinasalis]VEU77987.1 serine/threonine protein kinase [Mycoplasmopsis columbinasalis]
MNYKILENSNVFRKYKIISQIGSGGFAKVYKIQRKDAKDNTFYALKYTTLPENSNSESVKVRFEQEVEIYSMIASTKVAAFIEGYIDDYEQYLIMEYIDGFNLKDKLKEGRINVSIAVNYALQIAEGLQELHKMNIIHRDIKSNNVMITKDRNIKIIDFGLALNDTSQRYTQEQKIVGSVYYMAPELCSSRSQPTVQSDIYALGILLFEMLTGEYPFKGKNSFETMAKQKNESLPDIMKMVVIPQALANVIIKATAKDAAKRHASTADLIADLSTALDVSRVNEKPLNAKKIKSKLTFRGFVNSFAFIYLGIGIVSACVLLVVGLILGLM